MLGRGLVLTLMLAAVVGSGSAAGGEAPPALIVVDIQGFYFEGGAAPLEGSVPAAEQAARVLARFRALGWPVVHIQHLPPGAVGPGQDIEPPAYRIRPEVAPVAGERVVGKRHANAFRETALEATLRELGVTRLVLVGMQTHMCVEAAARAAADLGFEVMVVHDACATRDLEFKGAIVPAAQVHGAALAALDRTYARVVGADELLAELPTPKSTP